MFFVKKKIGYFFSFLKAILLPAIFLVVSCAGYNRGGIPESGIYHRVQKGETVGSIAQTYKVKPQHIIEANHLRKNDRVESGRVLFIPGAMVSASSIPARDQTAVAGGKITVKNDVSKEMRVSDTPANEKNSDETTYKAVNKHTGSGLADDRKENDSKNSPFAAKAKTDSLSWESKKIVPYIKKLFLFPVEGEIISRYGRQSNGLYNNGIEIKAKGGASVFASADGTVIFSALHPLKDYGETVIIKHDDDYVTVYTNMAKRLVQNDEHVKKGDKIGLLAVMKGSEDQVIHFEVRHMNKTVNPLTFFPDLQ